MTDFVEFLRKKKQDEAVDWKQAKVEWLASLDRFFLQLQSWLEEATKEGLLRVTEKTIQIEEEELGTYQAPLLIISFSERNTVEVKPVGRLIFGAKGRVDLISTKGRVTILLQVQEGKDLWLTWHHEAHQRKGYRELTQDLFFEIMRDMFS